MAVYFAAGCRTTGSDASEGKADAATPPAANEQPVTVESAAQIPSFTCTQGTPFGFKLAPTDPKVTEADVELPNGFLADSRTEGNPPGPLENVRLDVCVDDSVDPPTASLQRVITMGLMKDGVGKFGIVTNPQPEQSAGLGQLLFGQAGQFSLDLRVFVNHQFGKDVDFSMQLRGWSAKGQVGLAVTRTVQDRNPTDGTPLAPASGLHSVIGTLAIGNPINDAPPGQQQECGDAPARVETFKIETATFTMRICRNFIGTAGTTNYKILKMEVSDTSTALPANVRGKSFGTTCSEFNADASPGILAQDNACVWRLRHHNVCDSFVLRVPHATYGATNAPFGEALLGCEAEDVVPGAPTRSIDDQSDTFYYSIKVGAGAAKVFHEPCGKAYQRGCDQPGTTR